MECDSADRKYLLPSSIRRGRRDKRAYNQESDCPLHYRRHHSCGEPKQKNHRGILQHVCRRSSHCDILRPSTQQPRRKLYPHLQNQQNSSNGISTTTTTTTITTNNNNNNNHESENISRHSFKCLQQTHQQSLTTNCRSEAKFSRLQKNFIRAGGFCLEQSIPAHCRIDVHLDYKIGFINQESLLHINHRRLTITHIPIQHFDPSDYHQQLETRPCDGYLVYLRLLSPKRPHEGLNLSPEKQLKQLDKHYPLLDRSLEEQSNLICDWTRGGCDNHQGFYFPGQINLEKTQGKVLEAIRIKDEDKKILGQDFVMGGRETTLFPCRIIRDQTVSRPGHRDRKIENGDRATQTAEEFTSSVHMLAGANVCGKFQNHSESNARRTRLGNINNRIMSSITRDEINERLETNSENIAFNTSVNRWVVLKQEKSQHCVQETQSRKEVDYNINRTIHDKLKLWSKASNLEDAIIAPDSRNNVVYKTGRDFPANSVHSSLDQFLTVYTITRLRAFLFIFFLTCALHSISLGADRNRTPWPFPGADAKAVISLSKNVLMTDADHKQVSSLGKIDPPSESTKEDATFSDFPDVDSERSVAGASSRHGPGGKGKTGDRSDPNTKTKSADAGSENEDNVDEYEAYDDSTGQESADSTSKNQNERKKNTDNPGQYSDVEIADSIDEEDNDDDEYEEEDDEEEEEEEEDWAGDMSSQPIFLPPRMNPDGGQAGVGTTGKHFTEQETSAKSTDDPLKREIPEYMLKLYQKFTQKHYIHPASDTVRSFSNINDDILFNISKGNELLGAKTRNHTLVFNISSFPGGELINLAQLRLYKLVERDRNTYIGDDRKVSLYEVITQDDGTRHLKLVSQKHIYGRNSGWESFDVTPAVRRWVAEIESGAVQVLEVTIESIFNSVLGNDVDISTEPRSKKEPLLVVFSKQINKRLVHQQERDELLRHDMTLTDIEDVDNYTTTDAPTSLRSSASTNGHQSDDDEEEDDDDEDDDGEDSSKEDSYGSIDEMTSYAKVTQSMRTGKEYLSRSKQKVRVKRSKTSSKRNICRRTKLEVDFKDIEGHAWIVAPQRYQAFECSGKCYFPLGDHLRPTKHAIIRANLHVHNKKVTRPCCVPTKLDSISLLYLDSKTKGYTFKYNFEGMKVVECGCR